jgi:hypothetical protein
LIKDEMMKQYHNGQRKGMMYGGNTRKPMMYGGKATKPRKKMQMGGNTMSAPQQKQPAAGMSPMMPVAPMPTSQQRTPMAQGGKAFPDLTGDGKVTRKDILKGRGVNLMYGGKAKKRGK